MQDKIAETSHFFRRTEALADKLLLNRDDLPDKIGISKRMFYGYRKGTYPISSKAWRKLEAAEREAGIGPGAARKKDWEEMREIESEAPNEASERRDPDIALGWVNAQTCALDLALKKLKDGSLNEEDQESFEIVLKGAKDERGHSAFVRTLKAARDKADAALTLRLLLNKLDGKASEDQSTAKEKTA